MSFLFLSLLLAVDDSDAQKATSLDRERAFAREVLLGLEYGQGKAKIVRWTKSPSVSLIGGNFLQDMMVRSAVVEINSALKAGKLKMRLVKPGDKSASIKVYFAPLYRFDEIAKRHKIDYVKGNKGFVWLSWNGNMEARDAVIMISDDLKGDELRHYVLEELVQSLGFLNDSTREPKSILFEIPKKKLFGNATKLTPLDSKLIGFAYSRLKPGDTAEQLEDALRKHWTK